MGERQQQQTLPLREDALRCRMSVGYRRIELWEAMSSVPCSATSVDNRALLLDKSLQTAWPAGDLRVPSLISRRSRVKNDLTQD